MKLKIFSLPIGIIIITISLLAVIIPVKAAGEITEEEALIRLQADLKKGGIDLKNSYGDIQGANLEALGAKVYKQKYNNEINNKDSSLVARDAEKAAHESIKNNISNQDLKNKGSWSLNNEGKWEFTERRYLDIDNPRRSGECAEEGLKNVDFLVFHGPLVPCGVKKVCDTSSITDAKAKKKMEAISKPCTICHFIILIKNIFDLLLSLIITASLFMLTIAGVLYVISSGGAMTNTAKGIIEKTLLGFGVFLLSWLIVYTLLNMLSVRENVIGKGTADSWFQFDCDIKSSFYRDPEVKPNPGDSVKPNPGYSVDPITGEPVDPITGLPTWDRDKEIKDELKASGSRIYTPNSCKGTSSGLKSGCVTAYGLRQTTIDGSNNLQKRYYAETGNSLQINALADKIMDRSGKSYYNTVHTQGPESHDTGKKVDYQSGGYLDKFLTGKNRNIKNIPNGDTGGILVRNGFRDAKKKDAMFYEKGHPENIYVLEKGHWDVCYSCTPRKGY
jgi:hypothetical protein